jgi:mono/diheme cytochrome c family protein
VRCAVKLFVCVLGLVTLFATQAFPQPSPSPGLRATFSTLDDKVVDTKISSTVALYVPEGESPTEFLPRGKFRVVWNGFIRSDLRDDVSFQAEANGTLKLEIEGTEVLQVANSKSGFTQPVRLKKGLNVVRATFTSAAAGDAFVRVTLKSAEGFVAPLDPARLSYGDSAELQHNDAMREGMNLFLEHRCARCHETGVVNGAPDLNMDAPSFDGIGSRLREAWMARWIANPKLLRADAHMPRLRAASTAENAQAMAAFLASTGKNTNAATDVKLTSAEIKHARSVFENQHCDVCHFTEGVGVPDPKKVSLRNVGAKFYTDALRQYLAQPDAHYKWTGMPRYRLSANDFDVLARWLVSQSQSFAPASAAASTETVEHGKQLIETAGCLKCHTFNLPNKFSTLPLAKLDPSRGECLTGEQSVDFSFSPVERASLELWLGSDHASLRRNVPEEFAGRHYARLNCAECHEKIENIPPLNLLGAKLKPEWAGKFISGDITAKPRPWLQSQMPSFPQYATNLAQGLSAQQGFPRHSPTNASANAVLADVGAQLIVVPPRGLGCVQCHANGAMQPTLSDAPGINFSFVADRLQWPYFQRWVRKPSAIDSHTKMPAFFTEEGKSPLTQYFDGDAEKQIAAIWEHLQSRHQ